MAKSLDGKAEKGICWSLCEKLPKNAGDMKGVTPLKICVDRSLPLNSA